MNEWGLVRGEREGKERLEADAAGYRRRRWELVDGQASVYTRWTGLVPHGAAAAAGCSKGVVGVSTGMGFDRPPIWMDTPPCTRVMDTGQNDHQGSYRSRGRVKSWYVDWSIAAAVEEGCVCRGLWGRNRPGPGAGAGQGKQTDRAWPGLGVGAHGLGCWSGNYDRLGIALTADADGVVAWTYMDGEARGWHAANYRLITN